jgi:hypothetical protein
VGTACRGEVIVAGYEKWLEGILGSEAVTQLEGALITIIEDGNESRVIEGLS